MMSEIIVFFFILLILIAFPFFTHQTKGMPPGDWGLPIFGSIISCACGGTLSQYIKQLTITYGAIFHMKLGSRLFIVISDFHIIKAAFGNPDIQGRPNFYSFKLFKNFKNLGIAVSEGKVWQNGRRFAMRHLKEFGMGKSSLEETIQHEAKELIQDLALSTGIPKELSWNINVAVLNVLWKLVADRRYDVKDTEIQHFVKLTSGDFDDIQGPIALLDIFPFLIFLLPKILKDKWMNVHKMENSRDQVKEFIMSVIREHQVSLDPSNPRDYIDMYLLEINKHNGGLESTFTLEDLLESLKDLFNAGSETTSSTLRWFILYMAIHPDIQTKIHAELDHAVPKDKFPTLQDRNKLHYLEAVIHEVHRKASLAKFGLAHTATKDTRVHGYTIPKGAIVLANIEHCHNNHDYWEKPQEFYPEHFLDQQGRVVLKRDGFLPFSLGRRQCLGESLARTTLLIFTAAILHQFVITAPHGEDLSSGVGTEENPLFNFVKPFKVVLHKKERVM
ncbi:unnamed protein product [Meganyctiphanes norvegica]|uniref:Cytochrome P450 n=1 Tax=Meganyctiphanes norvegica TaxID=48144 RepID=A0AAV2PPK4_MEGNR